ncbi:MAG: FkbM family methyltransferase [Deltaproteobacteria bacterium]|nr:MAG: FkbM family methyltransferase [Deltaproteobacteria bacterium]
MLRKLGKSLLVQTLWTVIGRKNLVRLGRFLSNQARLDVLNDPSSNGELQIQSELWEHHAQTQGLCVFDVGANIGEWSQAFLAQAPSPAPSVQVHAFEPFPATFQTLQDNLSRWNIGDRVSPHNLALSSSTGTHTFYAIGDNIGVNSLHPHDPSLTKEESHETTVQTETLDDFCQRNAIEHIHFLKIDTEGHDYEVMSGARGMLAKGAIDILQFEYNARWILSEHFLRQVFHLLEPHGYVLGKVTPKGVEFYDAWHYELETFREANLLAMKPTFRPLFSQIDWWNR